MSPVLRVAVLAASTFVLFAAGLAALVAVAYPRARARLALRPPDVRARHVLGWAALPGLGSVALLALCFVPWFGSLLGVAADHCPLHQGGHFHLCFSHAPVHPITPAEWALLAAGGLAVGAVVLRVARAQVATGRAVSALLHLAGGEARSDGLVASGEPLSITAGLARPVVLVTTGLRNRLAPALASAVLAHERAHARRRDPLRLMVAALFGAWHAPATHGRIVADAALACEEAADEDAAREVGDRTIVAEAIVVVERLLGERARPVDLAVGMAGRAVEVRVAALLADPLPAAPPGEAVTLAWAAAAALSLLGAYRIHHLTESVLDVITR